MLTVMQHVMNTVCVLTRTSQRWKTLTRANGVLLEVKDGYSGNSVEVTDEKGLV
jgi:hypothetical protein